MKLTSLDDIKRRRPPDPERVAAIKRGLELEGNLHGLRRCPEGLGRAFAAIGSRLRRSSDGR